MHDADDPPPLWGWWEWYWHHANRWVEEVMRWARATGLLCALLLIGQAHATYKPEYALLPQEVQDWFKEAKLMPLAAVRLTPYTTCCDHADRFETKFHVNKVNGNDVWLYAVKDKWMVIPNDTIHDDPIPFGKTLEGQKVFAQMRAEGVLMIYLGQPFCFWPPDAGG